MRSSIIIMAGFVCFTGCVHQSTQLDSEPGPTVIDAQLADPVWQEAQLWELTDGQRAYADVKFSWPDKYLYFYITCSLRDINPDDSRFLLQFARGGNATPVILAVTTEGKCLDLSQGPASKRTWSPDAVLCRTATADDFWNAEIRIDTATMGISQRPLEWTATMTGLPQDTSKIWLRRHSYQIADD